PPVCCIAGRRPASVATSGRRRVGHDLPTGSRRYGRPAVCATSMNKSRRISFLIMAALLVLIGVFHLGVLVLTAMFGYFALQGLSFRRNKTIGVVLYLIVI